MFSRSFGLAVILAAPLALAGCANKAEVDASAIAPGSPRDFVVNVGDRVFFETDSTDLTPTAVATLDRQAGWLTRHGGGAVVVEGHADERGTREYNFALAARRAQVVRDYLASRGVERIRTVSYGKERPVAVCNDISCWSQNRRGVTVVGTGAGT